MKLSHQAWLAAHPDRSTEWLRKALKEGFDIHHLDGDPTNNKSDNLVLIERSDHFRLHGNSRLRRLVRNGDRWGEPGISPDGYIAYYLRKEGWTWVDIGLHFRPQPSSKRPGSAARQVVGQWSKLLARRWAKHYGKTWPIEVA